MKQYGWSICLPNYPASHMITQSYSYGRSTRHLNSCCPHDTHHPYLKLSVEGKMFKEGTWALGNRPGGALIASEELHVQVQQEEVRGEFQETTVFTPGTQ